MGMAAILFNGAEPFKHIVNTLSTEGTMWNLVKIAQAISEQTFKNYKILYMYIVQGQGQIYCKFQSLVFNTFWENDFWTFYPYKYMGVQIWHCCKNIKGQL